MSASRGRLLPALDRCFHGPDAIGPGSRLLIAFSGGPDSCALLQGLVELRETRELDFEAAHVDHRLDPDSPARAAHANAICRQLGVPLSIVVRAVEPAQIARGGLEAAARDARYTALEELRRERGAAWILTAHHRGDQVETVLLRLLHGSGWQGLAGIPARHGRIVRPLLEVDPGELRAALAGSGIEPSCDPSNRDLRLERNRLRHHLLPHLEIEATGIGARCVGIARAAGAARRRIERQLALRLDLGTSDGAASLDLCALTRLPRPLLPAAAALLHRAAGAGYPPSRAAVSELARQLDANERPVADAGDGWRWQAIPNRLRLVRPTAATPDFTYTVEVPGAVDLTEIELRLRIGRSPVAAWMFRGSPRRAGLGAALRPGAEVSVRNRRPGDRLRPLGCRYSRRLKDVLIDRGIPRAERDRIPLLCVDGAIAWVPGVTIDDRFRIRTESRVWVARLEQAGTDP